MQIIKDISEYKSEIPESVWAVIQEPKKSMQETDRKMNEGFEKTWNSIQETNRGLMEAKNSIIETRYSIMETDRLFKESRADYDRRMKKYEETMGAWANNHGSFAEEYFFNSFEMGKQNFFGEMFDEIEKNAKGFKKGFKDEYDILLINGKTVGIIEVKFKAHIDHIQKILRKAYY